MSENEKNIIKAVTEALPKMDERSKGYFLGFAEAIAAQRDKEILKDKEDCKEMDKKEGSPCQ